ncbi:MAG: hypothetical protein ACLFSU_05680, partial [Acholeplasmataceae bacterium]
TTMDHSPKGFALVFTMILLAATLILGTAAFTLFYTSYLDTKDQMVAFNERLATERLAQDLYTELVVMKNDGDLPTDDFTLTFDDVDYTVTYDDPYYAIDLADFYMRIEASDMGIIAWHFTE